MADTYMEEEYYEKAYILYLKYLTLFIEKVKIFVKKSQNTMMKRLKMCKFNVI